VSREIERRTVYVLLAKPIERSEFVLGKYVGLVLTLLVNTVVMSACFYGVLIVQGIADAGILLALLLLFLQLLVVTALAILFSCLSNPIVSCILTLALYVIGHLLWSLDLLKARMVSGAGKALCAALYYLLPHLERFDVKGQVVHGIPVPPSSLYGAAVYAVVYGSAVLLLACAVFQRKELS
jgi:ABC-type transport system involved in multi-copper enzyme maturation permease subunit